MEICLVTGGMGFIGSNFIRYLIEFNLDFKIINVDKLTYAGNPENLKCFEEKYPNQYKFYKVDICNFNAIDEIILKNNVDYIINFAAESHVDRSIFNPTLFYKTNIYGTLNLLNSAKKNNIKKFLQISTDEVYGSLNFNDDAFTENHHLAPNNPYSASKASADLIVRAYYKSFNLPVNITRCSNNYGPYQFPEKLIPLVIDNASNNKVLPVYGKGINVRDWIHVKDHCKAILKVLEKGNIGEIYNIGGDYEIANIDLVKKLLNILNKSPSLIRYVRDRPGHDLRYAMNHNKITKELHWKPEIDFENGLKMTVNWYFSNNEWLENVKTKEYLKFNKTQ